ncbi:cysteinyl-trna synthetase [Holotrichia oblita]|uniref:Cysteinyl-trna synthetase n=1 Tax=Holotrichia oblita TaxID=644536 RepID=A0ACB9SUC0_HOLOL|nr:cysteinyl-trna synthetase [Holotrichia oblita]
MLLLRKAIISNSKRFKTNWIQPEGYDTGIKVYNCVTRTKVPLVVANKSCVTMYTCGPTVYDSAHIGHASCYVKLDIIQRILRRYFKLNLVTVMNITDIDDKIINESKNLNKSPIEVARCHEKEYIQDLDQLLVTKPDVLLFDEKFAYKSEDGSVYFDVSQYENYGKLQKIGENTLEVNTGSIKNSPADFALWKAAKPNEPYWDSFFGPGRPGWHIECSALAGNIIGSSVDIHAGGIDLRFPHHENEEAQSCTFFSKPQWVNYWLHTGHLHLRDSVKMSKSLKNTISIQDMLKTVNPVVFRVACLLSHYRRQLQSTIDNKSLIESLSETMTAVDNALQDDFNTPVVIESIHRLMTVTNKMLHTPSTNSNYLNHSVYVTAVMNFVLEIFKVFGVDILSKQINEEVNDYSDIIDVLIKFRQNVRQLGISERNENALKLCDETRDELRNLGVYIKDHGKISSWSR